MNCSAATINAAAVTVNAPALAVNGGIATFSGVVQCSALITNAVLPDDGCAELTLDQLGSNAVLASTAELPSAPLVRSY